MSSNSLKVSRIDMIMVPRISIIVPIYNTEKYIKKCLDSILKQTFIDFEVLLVDDGSSDCSGMICEDYATKDNRFRVFHKNNGGVSSARNIGLKMARGEWIMFLDSDDEIADNTLDTCYVNATVNNIDVLQYSTTRSYEDLGKKMKNPLPCSVSDYIRQKLFMVCIGGSFIRSSIIFNNNISFNESLKLAEDLIFIHTCLGYSQKCQRLYDLLYYYRDNSESSSNNRSSIDMIKSCMAQYRLKSQFPIFSAAIDSSVSQYILSTIINNDYSNKSLYDLIQMGLPYNLSLMKGTQLIFALIASVNIPLAVKVVKWRFYNKLRK